MSDVIFDLSPTQYDFCLCDANIVQLMGPMGEGKTVAGVAGCVVHAQRCGTDIRAAIIRDTFQNIKTSTIPDIRDYLKDFVKFSDGEKRCAIMSQPRVELDLFGIDDEASVSKLQGPQYAMIWIEEPAPILEKANAGLPKSVFDLAIARSARQRGTIMRVQITQNPADDEHWTSDLEDAPEDYASFTDEQTGEVFTIKKRSFKIRPGENKYLPGLTRAALRAAFKDDPAKAARYIAGNTASVVKGERVTPGYSEAIHYSGVVLPVYPDIELISMWDGWHHPSCVLAQYTPFGQLVFHDVLVGEGKGTEDLIEEQLLPLLRSGKYNKKIRKIRVIGDPSMMTPDQSSVKRITGKIVCSMLKDYGRISFERGPVKWPNRREPINQCFKKLLNGGIPAVMLSRSAFLLNKAFKGGWVYKTDNSGKVISDKPIQNKHDHPAQAAAYGVSVLMPYSPKNEYDKILAVHKAAQLRRAMSYSGNNFTRARQGSL